MNESSEEKAREILIYPALLLYGGFPHFYADNKKRVSAHIAETLKQNR
jgi:hypothetical protein